MVFKSTHDPRKARFIRFTIMRTLVFGEKNRQNDVVRLSAFCPNAVFGNMSVHRYLIETAQKLPWITKICCQ